MAYVLYLCYIYALYVQSCDEYVMIKNIYIFPAAATGWLHKYVCIWFSNQIFIFAPAANSIPPEKGTFQFFSIILCDELYENMAHVYEICFYVWVFVQFFVSFFTYLSNAILDGVLYESDIFCYPFTIWSNAQLELMQVRVIPNFFFYKAGA